MTAGRHIHIERWGRGPRLVLLHGWTMRGAVMAPLAEALPGFTCLAPDLPGHGATTGYPADLPGAVAMLGELLADGEPTVLVGWSLGALVGWHCPGPLRGMVSLDMSPRPLPAPDWDFGMGPDAARIRAREAWFRDDWSSAVGPLAAGIFAPGAAPALVETAAKVIAAQDGPVMAGFWASLVEADCRASVRALPVPLLAIHGAASRVYPPACAHWLARAAPMGAAHVVDSAGHAPHLEAPGLTAALIADFAERVLPP